jgi:hypothetical protein
MTNDHGPIKRTRRVAPLAAAVLVLALGGAACGTQADDTAGAGDRDAARTIPTVEAQQFTPVVASTIGGETAPVRGTDGRYHVVYELQLTNAKAIPATIRRVVVLDQADPDRVIETIKGRNLVENMRTLATTPVEDATIEPNGSRLLFVQLAFDSAGQAPESLIHRLYLLGPENPGSTEATPLRYTITPFVIGDKVAPILGPPLKGDGWVAVNGCCGLGFVHRDAVQSINGSLWDAQRFAIDFMRLDEDGRFVTGDVSDPENWTQYGAEVIAAADGTVVSVANNFPNQIPGSLPDPGSFDTVESVDGNHVIIKFDDGVYAFYAHFQKGSIVFEPGDEVEQGDKLGLLGNSGNTSAPHLHFHLMTGPEALGSDGIPFMIDSFGYEGQVPARQFAESDDLTGAFDSRRTEPEPRDNELPLNLAIVSFPGE